MDSTGSDYIPPVLTEHEQQEVLCRSHKDLLRQSKTGAFIYILAFVATVFVHPFLQQEKRYLIIFAVLFLCSATARFIYCSVLQKNYRQELIFSYKLVLLSTLLVWGIFSAWVISHSPTFEPASAMTVTITSVFMAGITVSLRHDLNLVKVGNTILVLPPLLSFYYFSSTAETAAIELLSLFYYAFLWIQSSRQYREYWESLQNIFRLEKQAKELQESRNEALELSNAKSDFLAHISHEIRTPLNGVVGMTDLLELTKLEPEQIGLVDTIKHSSRILLGLISDILDVSKINSGHLELNLTDFSLQQLMTDFYALIVPQAEEKNLQLTMDLSRIKHHDVMGDALRIEQILLNLVSNAIKYTAKGGITISAQTLDLEEEDSLTFRVAIKDSGAGIPEAFQQDIFEQFVQVENFRSNTRGVGLGLAICKKLTTAMGGKIGFDSKEGAGSTFWFEIPLPKRAKATLTTALSPALGSPEPSGKEAILNILVAEDNAVNQKLISAYLDRLNCSQRISVNGNEAFAMFQEQKPDIVLMDCQMPEMDGMTACRLIRQYEQANKLKRTPIVALTAHSYSEIIDEIRSCDMDDHLAKPILLAQLNSMLQKWSA